MSNAVFTRQLKEAVIKQLKSTPLFQEKLLPDIISGEVFPAIRNNYIDFYYKGGRLFHFDGNGFSTHYKYLTRRNIPHPYVSSIVPKDYIVESFYVGYNSIKYLCALYSGTEANLISTFYKQSLLSQYRIKGSDSDIFLLDIECSLEAMDEKDIAELDLEKESENKTEDGLHSRRKSVDRIDLVFWNQNKGKLFFCEAKRYDDGRTKGNTPEVIKQIEKYNSQLTDKSAVILAAYMEYLRAMGQLFGVEHFAGSLSMLSSTVLLVTGYDESQNKVGIPGMKQALAGVPVKFVGKPNKDTPKELYRIALT